jgi:hypothetical protein
MPCSTASTISIDQAISNWSGPPGGWEWPVTTPGVGHNRRRAFLGLDEACNGAHQSTGIVAGPDRAEGGTGRASEDVGRLAGAVPDWVLAGVGAGDDGDGRLHVVAVRDKEGVSSLAAVDHGHGHARADPSGAVGRDGVEPQRHVIWHAQMKLGYDGRDRGRENGLQHPRSLDQHALKLGAFCGLYRAQAARLGLLLTDHVDMGDVTQPVGLGVHQALEGNELAAREGLKGGRLTGYGDADATGCQDSQAHGIQVLAGSVDVCTAAVIGGGAAGNVLQSRLEERLTALRADGYVTLQNIRHLRARFQLERHTRMHLNIPHW